MKRFLLIVCVLLATAAILRSQPDSAPGGQVPRVVIGIVVENMRPDYIYRYWNGFGEGGLKKLSAGGIRYDRFIMPLHILNPATGTATLFTGSYPAVHGIVDVTWYDRTKGEVTGCVDDPGCRTAGSPSSEGGVSPRQLRASSLGDRLKIFHNGKAKVFSVAMNEAPAIFSAGYSGDAAYWYDPGSGNMVTSSWYRETLPGWATAFNARNLSANFSARNWVILKSASDYGESAEDNCPQEPGYGPGRNTFPHSMATLVKNAGNYAPLKTTPFANTLIREFAQELISQEEIGTDRFTDLVTLFFSSMDYENGNFGPASVEMQDLYLRLDGEIAALISFAEEKFGKGNVLFFLTANSSAPYPVDYLKERFRFPAGRFSPENAVALLNSYLNITFGDLKWVEYNNGLQLYLNHKLIDLNKVDLNEIRKKTADFMAQFEGVRRVVTAAEARDGEMRTPFQDPVANNWFENRSGDVMVELREGWQISYKSKKSHYSGETHLPLFFYGTGTAAKVIDEPLDATGFYPALSTLLGMPPR